MARADIATAAAAADDDFSSRLSAPAPSKSSMVTGWHEFTMERYSAAKGVGLGRYIPSGAFSVGGHRWQIYFYPDGPNRRDADFVAIFVQILMPPDANDNNTHNPSVGGEKVLAFFGFQLLDGDGRALCMHRMASGPYLFSRVQPSFGFYTFMRRADLEASPSLHSHDLLTVRCSLHVYRSHPQPEPEPTLNYRLGDIPGLGKHLSLLLHSGLGADVTLTLPHGGKSFRVHRCILAARSPAFKAQLLPNSSLLGSGPVIVEDMEADTLESLLHFIYTDSLPHGQSLIVQGTGKDESILKTQCLLAAADRYGVDKLKMICEDKLCENMTLGMVGDTLGLAERHNCPRLKAVCFEFMTKFATHARQNTHSQLKRPSSDNPVTTVIRLDSSPIPSL